MDNVKDKIGSGLNIIAPIASVASILNPAFAVVPIVASVYNEVCEYFDSKSVEKRLKKLEDALFEKDITIKDFSDRLDTLNEHDQYVFRNNLKYLCLSAIPEVTDTLIDSMIAFLMEESPHEMNEEICEILQDFNATDIQLMHLFKEYLDHGCREKFNSKLQEAEQEHAKVENNYEVQRSSRSYKRQAFHDRNIIFNTNTIFWADFICEMNFTESVSASVMMNEPAIDEDGREEYAWSYLVRSLIKMQRLGVIEIEYINTLGVVSEYNIDRFHITLFGRFLLKHVK